MAMLGLPDEVGGDHVSIGGIVGDDRDLGRTGEHVDADLAEKHALRLGNELVARTDDDVRRLAGEQVRKPGWRSPARHRA